MVETETCIWTIFETETTRDQTLDVETEVEAKRLAETSLITWYKYNYMKQA